MAVAVKSYVARADVVFARIADQCRADEKAVRVIVDAPAVIVKRRDPLDRVAFRQKILVKEIRDVHILASSVECVEAAVCVFFELMKIGKIELVPIICEATKEPCTEIIIGKKKSSK